MPALNQETVTRIAARHGLEAADERVVRCAEQAALYHGIACDAAMREVMPWGCDENGAFDAEKLLDGYLSQPPMTVEEALAGTDCAFL